MKRLATFIKNILLIFVLISIGFILGKNFSSQNVNSDVVERSMPSIKTEYFVDVYYFHSTFRCSTCNKIEKLTESLLKTDFRKQLDDKRIVFTDINFQEDEKLAKKFGVVASCVVVALKQNEKILKFRRLDEVWTLIDNPKKIREHISIIIKEYLNLSYATAQRET